MKNLKNRRLSDLNDCVILDKKREEKVVGGVSLEEFEEILRTGIWEGGYVDGLGYVLPEVVVYGSAPTSSSSSNSPTNPCICEHCERIEKMNNPLGLSGAHKSNNTPLTPLGELLFKWFGRHSDCCTFSK